MSKKKTSPAAEPAPIAVVADPNLLTSTVKVGGKEYTLCFDMRTLATIERQLRAEGHNVNLLEALPSQTIEHLLVTFAASIRRFHPEIGFVEALAIPKLTDIYAVSLAIAEAWRKSLPEVDPKDAKKNPTGPGAKATGETDGSGSGPSPESISA